MKSLVKNNEPVIKENKNLKSHDHDPYIKQKMEKATAILKNLKNPVF